MQTTLNRNELRVKVMAHEVTAFRLAHGGELPDRSITFVFHPRQGTLLSIEPGEHINTKGVLELSMHAKRYAARKHRLFPDLLAAPQVHDDRAGAAALGESATEGQED